ncbi:hypothetical protein BN14_07935 [Rhizoctonia solani AG-1 IB]|nr:unnamed protein product [Rhizoctonia solani]CCO33849.1 hypothetical protein BN14_07935 [Rhizoctonia solani AG-1 IB]
MTISPFGLLGQCSSKSFKRRLREEYHVKSEEGDADTLRVAKFLRDFVIDFGPASLEQEQSAETKPEALLPTIIADDEESAHTRFPSMLMESYTMLARHSEDEDGVEVNHMNNRSWTNSAV